MVILNPSFKDFKTRIIYSEDRERNLPTGRNLDLWLQTNMHFCGWALMQENRLLVIGRTSLEGIDTQRKDWNWE